MQGKRPTKKQRIFLKSKKLNDENWLVCKDTTQEMVVKHRQSDKYRTIQKGRQSDEGINIIEKQ